MEIRNEINQLQKQLLLRLKVKTGSTLYIIIQEISRQAYAKSSMIVSQKNSTLASKCGVTASTISRNLKKLKDKCSDLIMIEQNRNTEEQFAALIFTFQCQTETSNGEQTELVIHTNESDEVAEITSNSSLKTDYNFYQNYNINTVNKDVEQSRIIHDVFLEYAKKGIKKSLFLKILEQVKSKENVKNFKGYLQGALKKVIKHISLKNEEQQFLKFYDEVDKNKSVYKLNGVYFDWLNV